MRIGEKIRELRLSRGWTLEQFGSHVDNASKSNVSKWETDTVTPNHLRLKLIADLAGMSVSEFIGKQVTTNNVSVTPQGDKYTIIITEGKQDRWLTVDEDTARELVEKLAIVLGGN